MRLFLSATNLSYFYIFLREMDVTVTKFRIMKQLRIFSALLLCLFWLSLPAAGNDEIKYFVLWHSDGRSTALALQEHPRIKVDAANKQIICATDSREISLTMADVRRYSFEETADITSIGEILAPVGSLDKQGVSLILSNFPSGEKVSVYTSGGILKSSHTTDGAGSLTLYTQGWEQGLYIVKTEKITYKILVK